MRQTDKLAVLPLADRPQAAQLVIDQLHLADNGVEFTARQLGRDGFAVDIANAFNGLLQHFKAGIGDGTGPAVRRLTVKRDMAFEIGSDRFAVRIDTTNAHDAIVVGPGNTRIDREGSANAEIEYLRAEIGHDGLLG